MIITDSESEFIILAVANMLICDVFCANRSR